MKYALVGAVQSSGLTPSLCLPGCVLPVSMARTFTAGQHALMVAAAGVGFEDVQESDLLLRNQMKTGPYCGR
jgi:hypothetical protein